jgi:hemerythrin-like domain-containing protein
MSTTQNTAPNTTQKPAWPAQLHLPGQTAAPEGPVDMFMMYVMHHAFRRDLAKLADAAQCTPVEDRVAWRLLQERWSVFAEALHGHHSGEDEGLWPLLLERGTEQDVETLEAMEAEHAEFEPLLEACEQGFARLAEHADDAARAALAVRLAATRECLARHLEHEETGAIPIIQRVLTQEDWERLDEEVFKEDLTPGKVVRVVPWAAYGVPANVLDDVFAKAGFGFKVVWFATRRRFARREARAFRHLA